MHTSTHRPESEQLWCVLELVEVESLGLDVSVHGVVRVDDQQWVCAHFAKVLKRLENVLCSFVPVMALCVGATLGLRMCCAPFLQWRCVWVLH